ncbi:STAS domain-containing protein [Actinoplanes sp. NPDC049265]|uniref:STAS domain-containing protein n=1 Tax=Actinoplanes sp. NPDC049265 TaxID=3363902 RepID=UPI00371DED86
MTGSDGPRVPGVVTPDASADGLVRLAAGGEFDRDNNHLLIAAVEAAISDGCATVTIDLGAVTFIDASTVTVLLQCNEIAARHRRTMRVVNPAGMPALVLDTAGAWSRLAEPDGYTGPDPVVVCVRREDLLTAPPRPGLRA